MLFLDQRIVVCAFRWRRSLADSSSSSNSRNRSRWAAPGGARAEGGARVTMTVRVRHGRTAEWKDNRVKWLDERCKPSSISSQTAPAVTDWMGCSHIPLCHGNNCWLWIRTYTAANNSDTGSRHHSSAPSRCTPTVRASDCINFGIAYSFSLTEMFLFECRIHFRLRDSFPWLGQWWKSQSSWGLSLVDRRWWSPGRADRKSHWSPLLDAKLLLYLMTLVPPT